MVILEAPTIGGTGFREHPRKPTAPEDLPNAEQEPGSAALDEAVPEPQGWVSVLDSVFP